MNMLLHLMLVNNVTSKQPTNAICSPTSNQSTKVLHILAMNVPTKQHRKHIYGIILTPYIKVSNIHATTVILKQHKDLT